ncbi:MAG: beta-L-arabinofuranosidase domain-containing protein [Bacteroidota bacterium]
MKLLTRLNAFLLFFTLIVNKAATQSNVILVEKEIAIGKEPKPIVEFKVKDLFESAPFAGQSMQGYLGKRFSQNLTERLLKVDEKGIMAGYLERPGVHPWIGEHVGKYLESATNVWRTTHDERLKKQMDRIVNELIHSQLEDGYLGTYLPKDYWTSWDVWSHKYNMYGLLAYYTATGYQPALDACKKMGDLLCKTFGDGPGQRDILLAGEHMGMAATSVLDPMVELYRYSGQKKYLDFCYYILKAWDQEDGPKVITALLATGNVTKVGNAKAYEMLSNFVGIAKLYRVTGEDRFLKVVKMAWQDIVKNRLYISGTTSSMEFFQVDKVLPASSKDNMGEGCVTTTWIQLNQNLLAITGDVKYLEQIEKSIYNQLLAAENPQTGCVSYYTALMDKKPYSCDISCCTSSVPRGIAMIPYFTMGNLNSIPTVLLYEPGVYKNSYTTARNKKIDFTLKIETDFPESGTINLTFKSASNIDSIPLAFRVPSWCGGFVIKMGSQEYKKVENNCVTVKRRWTSGEKLTIKFDIGVQEIQGGKSYPGMMAFQRGPQVLAFDESLNQEFINANSKEMENSMLTFKPASTSCSELLPKQWIGKQAYSFMLTNNNKLVFVPFADASQTGAAIKVWMPLKPIE